MARPLRLILLALGSVALGAFVIVGAHDAVVDREEASCDSAAWKCAIMSPGQVPAPWRIAMLEEREGAAPSDVVNTAPGRFSVPGLVERQRQDGRWERGRCSWKLWREEFDCWHLLELAIEGEPAKGLEVTDGPTGAASRLWLSAVFG